MNASELIDQAMTHTGEKSLRGLADAAGLDHAQLSKWQRDELPLTLEGALILGKLAGMRPEKAVGQLVTPRSDSKVLRELFKEWARTAACILVAIAATYTFQPSPAALTYPSPEKPTDPLYIM